MAQYDGSIRINTQINTSGIQKGVSAIGGSIGGIRRRVAEARNSLTGLNGVVKNLGLTIAAAFSAKALVRFGREATRLGSELQEVDNVVSVAFPNMTKAMDEFAASAMKNFGLSETMAKRYSALFGTMAKQFNFTEKEAFEMGTTLAGLAGDVASFYDIDQDLAYIKLKSVFSGETETLKDIGVVMTEAALNQFALSKGIDRTVNKMTEQEKVALRYQFVLERLSQASGDFIRTSDSWANQTRVLKLQFNSLRATLGQGFINVLTPVVKMINTLLSKLGALAQSFRSFTELITGNKATSGKGAGLAGMGAETSGMGDGYDSAAAGAENLASATDKAAKATKDAKKEAEGYLSPLDEINKIGKEDVEVPEIEEPKGEGVGGVVPGMDYGNLAEGETALDKMKGTLGAVIERAKELAGIFKKGFFEGLGDYGPRLEDLKNDISSIGRTLKEIFTDPAVLSAATRFGNQLAYTLGQVAGSAASIGLTIANNLVGGLEKYLAQNKERIKSYLIEMFDIGTDILKTIGDLSVAVADIFSVFGGDTAQQITGNLIGIFAEVGMMVSENAAKLGRDILNMIAQPIIDNKEKIKKAIQGTLEAIESFTSGLLTAVQTVRDAVTEIYDQHLKPLFDSVADGLSEIFGKLLDGYNEYIVPVLKGLGERFKELMEGPFGEAIDKVKDFIGKLIDALKLLWEEVLVPLFGWIAENIMPILADVIEFIGNNVLNILKIIIEAIGNIADVLSGVIDFIVGVFTGDWEKAWTGIKEIFSGVWELIKGIVSGAWDEIKDAISGAITIISDIISAAWDGIKEIWGAVSTWFSDNVITPIADFFKELWDDVSGFFKSLWDDIKEVWESVSGWFSENVTEPVSNFFKGVRTNVSGYFSDLWKDVKGVWGSVSSWFSSTVIDPVKNAWKTATDAIAGFFSSLWKGIANGVVNAMNAVIGAIEGGINFIIGGINSMLGGFNSIVSWAADIVGVSWGGVNLVPEISLSRIPIPYLAQGTVVPPNREFMAVLGDNKREPEVVSPISTIERAVANVMARSGGAGQPVNITLQVVMDKKVVGETAVSWGELQQMATGRNPFLLGNA